MKDGDDGTKCEVIDPRWTELEIDTRPATARYREEAYIDASLPPVNTVWTDWGEWGACDANCSQTKRSRSCPHPEYGGLRDCSGDADQEKECCPSKCRLQAFLLCTF